MSTLEESIYAAAYVDALRSIFVDIPERDRVKRAAVEAARVVEMHRKWSR